MANYVYYIFLQQHKVQGNGQLGSEREKEGAWFSGREINSSLKQQWRQNNLYSYHAKFVRVCVIKSGYAVLKLYISNNNHCCTNRN
jgi:hypothetical protein